RAARHGRGDEDGKRAARRARRQGGETPGQTGRQPSRRSGHPRIRMKPKELGARSVRLRITGRVQGVGYRAWAMRQASALGLRGWVRNRSDGSVEVLLIGGDEAVERMIERCRQGPLGRDVTDVAVSEAPDDGSDGFSAKE